MVCTSGTKTWVVEPNQKMSIREHEFSTIFFEALLEDIAKNNATV
jgi:hypothetical protein